MDSEIGDVVGSVEAAVAALTSCDPFAVSSNLIGSLTVRLQRALQKLQVCQAGFVSRADACAVWMGTTERSTAAWLATATGTSFGPARRQVDLAVVLDAAPSVREAVIDGTIALETVAALGSAVLDPTLDADTLGSLVDSVSGIAPSQARKVVARWEAVRVSQSDGAQAEAQRHAKRSLTFTNTDDGMVRIEGTLTVIDARIIRNALSHVAGAPIDGDTRNTGQRTADALTDLCHAYAKGTITGGRGAQPFSSASTTTF